MSKLYSLCILFRHRAAPVLANVSKADHDRLKSCLDERRSDDGFFWCDTTDGKSLAINLTNVQAVRFLGDSSADQRSVAKHNGLIQIHLSGRDDPITAGTEAPVTLFDMLSHLQYGPEQFPFPSFEDEDGETVQLNAKEVDFVEAPAELLRRGQDEIEQSD